jgi:ankyrin repeat protein
MKTKSHKPMTFERLMSRSFGKESSNFWSWSLSPRGLQIRDVRQYLDDGGDPNHRNERQQTLLHIAADNGEVEIVKLLLARGVDINARGYRNYTALHLTVDAECVVLTEKWLSTSPWRFRRPQNVTMSKDYRLAELSLTKVLIDAGADESARDDDGDTPRDIAVVYGKKLAALYDAVSKLPDRKTDYV